VQILKASELEQIHTKHLQSCQYQHLGTHLRMHRSNGLSYYWTIRMG